MLVHSNYIMFHRCQHISGFFVLFCSSFKTFHHIVKYPCFSSLLSSCFIIIPKFPTFYHVSRFVHDLSCFSSCCHNFHAIPEPIDVFKTLGEAPGPKATAGTRITTPTPVIRVTAETDAKRTQGSKSVDGCQNRKAPCNLCDCQHLQIARRCDAPKATTPARIAKSTPAVSVTVHTWLRDHVLLMIHHFLIC